MHEKTANLISNQNYKRNAHPLGGLLLFGCRVLGCTSHVNNVEVHPLFWLLSKSRFVKKIATPFKDKNDQIIYSGDICKSWSEDSNIEPEQGEWLFEKVCFYKNDWYLFDIYFNYQNSDEEPVLLSKYHNQVEVTTDTIE